MSHGLGAMLSGRLAARFAQWVAGARAYKHEKVHTPGWG
jgi:hypothetical protein